MDFVFENMVAINFINLDKARACEVLEARNAVSEFMLTNRKISKAEHFRFIDSLRENKNNAYFAVYEKDCKSAESRLDSANPSPLNSFDSSHKRAAPPTPLPPTFLKCVPKSCRFSLLGGEPRFSASSKKSAGGTTAPFESDFLHHEAGEFSGASHKIDLDSANPQNSQNLLGVICFNSIDLANKNACFGIYSNGKNNGAKLLQILRFIAFEGLNLHILYAKVLSTNARAIRFYKKNGFVRCGVLPEALRRNDKFIDLEIWALKNNAK